MTTPTKLPVSRSILWIGTAALAGALGLRLGVEACAQDDLPPPTEQIKTPPQPEPRDDGFQRTRRQGAVVVQEEYDVSEMSIPLDEIHELLPRDAIPALTDPKLENILTADWLPPDVRVIEISINGQAVAAPFMILNFHEIANMTVGGEPVAATYCPLCDSASVVSRRVTPQNGSDPVVLEFGVSGALYNSNVLMYDQRDKALWSQVAMKAVSGPLVGTKLAHYPARIVTAADFALRHPKGKVISIDTGHARTYARGAYEHYLLSDRIIVDVESYGDALPAKTLGLGIQAGDQTWFISADAAGPAGKIIQTPLGPVRVHAKDGGVAVDEAPDGVQTMQSFYYSWSAFHPETEVITE